MPRALADGQLRLVAGRRCTSGLMAWRRSLADCSFGRPTSARAVQDLALQVAEIDDVEVHEAESADAGGGEVQSQRRAETAGTDQQHPAGLEAFLSLHADFRHDEVAAVAFGFVGAEAGGRGPAGQGLV